MIFKNTHESMNENDPIYQEMFLELIQNGSTRITNLERLNEPRRGYSGIVHYHDKGFQFEAEVDLDDEPCIHFTIPFFVIVNDLYAEDLTRLTILTNYLIEGYGDVLPNENGRVYLSRTVSLGQTVTSNFFNDVLSTLAGISYAFEPYYEIINRGKGYRLKINYGGSLLAKLIYHLIPGETENPGDDIPWYDEVNYRGEEFYQILSRYYDRESAHIECLLTEYDIRKMLLDKIDSLMKMIRTSDSNDGGSK